MYLTATTAIVSEKAAAKKSAYQTISPEDDASGQCWRIRRAQRSPAGLNIENERTRVTTPAIIVRNMRTIACDPDLAILTRCEFLPFRQ